MSSEVDWKARAAALEKELAVWKEAAGNSEAAVIAAEKALASERQKVEEQKDALIFQGQKLNATRLREEELEKALAEAKAELARHCPEAERQKLRADRAESRASALREALEVLAPAVGVLARAKEVAPNIAALLIEGERLMLRALTPAASAGPHQPPCTICGKGPFSSLAEWNAHECLLFRRASAGPEGEKCCQMTGGMHDYECPTWTAERRRK